MGFVRSLGGAVTVDRLSAIFYHFS